MTSRYISVFSGAGGLDLGLGNAGFTCALATDSNSASVETLKAHGMFGPVVRADIHDMLNDGSFRFAGRAAQASAPVTLVAGGPPLIGPVSGGDVDPDDEAPQLLFRFLDVVEQARPQAFIMEALPFLGHPRWGRVVDALRATSRKLGYDAFTPVIDASEYGVPQRRARMFLIGMPPGTRPDVTAAPRPGSKVSAGAALRAMDRNSRDIPCASGVTLARSPEVKRNPYASQLVAGPARVLDLAKVAASLPAALGANKTPVIDLHQLESNLPPWVEGYHAYLVSGGRPLYKLPAEARMRRLSLRECLVLQGFPAGYPLRGLPLSQFRITGSACPPPLAEAVGRAVMAGLS